MTTTTKRYEIVIKSDNNTGKVVYASNRIDHANKRFDRELADNSDQDIVLHDNREDQRLRAHAGRAAAAAAKRKANRPKKHRVHNNGDFVAVALDGHQVEEVYEVAVRMFQACHINSVGVRFTSTENRRNREMVKLESARTRSNTGSGRMTLGLMIRKYCQELDILNADHLDAFLNREELLVK